MRHRREQHAQVLLRVAERALAQAQRLVGERHLLGGRQLGEGHGVARVPLAVGLRVATSRLTSSSSTMRPRSRSTRNSLPGCRRPRRRTCSGGMSSRPDSEPSTTWPSVVSTQRPGRRPLRSSVAPTTRPSVNATDAGPVPRLHQAGVEGVEALQVLGQVLAVAVGLGDHHHRRVRQRAPGEHQQLEHVVERRRVGVAGR